MHSMERAETIVTCFFVGFMYIFLETYLSAKLIQSYAFCLFLID